MQMFRIERFLGELAAENLLFSKIEVFSASWGEICAAIYDSGGQNWGAVIKSLFLA